MGVGPSSSHTNPTSKRSVHLKADRTIFNLLHAKTEDKPLVVSSVSLPPSATVLNPAFTAPDHDICLISDSPHYVVRIAGTGNVDEFDRLVRDDPAKLTITNPAGLCAAHSAAARNRVPILALIVQFDGDLNIEDKDRWTPLHHAARNNAVNAIEFLLDNGVEDARLNKQKEAAVHVAVMHNQLQALRAFFTKRPEQVNLAGERGRTPLHYAALVDNVDVAKILIEFNVRLCVPNHAGIFPIHIAALSSANRVLALLFSAASSLGYDSTNLLNFCDYENHRPLHSSVIGGNIEAVEICLNNGGKIDDQQEDLSTPVHLAASQGSIEILKLMFNCQADLKSKVIAMTDVQGMTPLHKAAMGDHVDMIEFLLESGAHIDARDLSKRTPLLVAALKASVQAVCCLMSKNASVINRDENDRNLLHFAIIQSLPMEMICEILFKRDNYRVLFDQRDTDGYYPIHYASREGQVNVLTTLIEHGAEINKKTNERQSSLHFAAQYGRYQTCSRLLNTPGFERMLNEPDKLGQTPLHLSCQNGHTRVVQLLVHKGAQFTKSYEGNTPLHDAAGNGHVATMNTILQAHAHLINAINRLGMTPLHLAAADGHVDCVDLLLSKAAQFLSNTDAETFFDLAIKKKQKDVCLAIIAHDRWKEALDLNSTKYRTPLLGLIEHLPECVSVLFDRCITHSHDDRKNKDFHLIYDFRFVNYTDRKEINGKAYRCPILPLNMMVKFGRTNHLSHPLSETLLRQKWRSYGFPIYALNLTFYLLFLILLSYFVITFPSCNHHDATVWPTVLHHCPRPDFISFNKSVTFVQLASIWFIVFYCFFNFVLEVVQLVQDGREYFGDLENYVQWILYVSTSLFTFPFLFDQSWHYQWVAGSISIFTAYLALLFLLGRFDIYGIYVIMFLEIMKTLLHVLSLFSILIIGFALTFCVIRPFPQDLNPSNPQDLFKIALKTVTMMLGELNYDDSYLDASAQQHFNTTNLVILILFALIMPILLMNLLVGLAIGDLMQIQQNARLKSLALQVQFHTNLEKKMPEFFLKRFVETDTTVHHNINLCDSVLNVLKQWMIKPSTTYESPDIDQQTASDNLFLVEISEQKQRQRDMQRQLDTITRLVRLIVEKMEIRAEINIDDTSDSTRDEIDPRLQRFRRTFHAARQFSQFSSSTSKNETNVRSKIASVLT